MHALRHRTFGAVWVVTLLLAGAMGLGLTGQAQEATPAVDLSQLTGRIVADGSSTVWPVMTEAAERFMAMAPVTVDIGISGTGGGFGRFCAGETDLQNASRPITEEERAACEAAGVQFEEFTLGFDGITVVVHPENTWAECLTVEQLHAIWEPNNPEATWQAVDPAWPASEIELYGPGSDSGTFDYFTEVINGEAGRTRTDYAPSENDFYLVEGVASQPNALGYFGYAYYVESADRLQAVAIDNGNGCVLPTPETIADGSYAPLARPLFLYVNRASLGRPAVREFLRHTIDQAADIVTTVGYVPLPAAEYAANRERFTALMEQLAGQDG